MGKYDVVGWQDGGQSVESPLVARVEDCPQEKLWALADRSTQRPGDG